MTGCPPGRREAMQPRMTTLRFARRRQVAAPCSILPRPVAAPCGLPLRPWIMAVLALAPVPALAQPLLPLELRAPGLGEPTPSASQPGSGPTSPVATAPGLDAFPAPFATPVPGLPAAEPGPLGPSRPYIITPSLGLRLLGTDNVRNTATNRQADFITFIEPSLAVEANSLRATGRFFYSPSARIYAETNSFNSVFQSFSGQGLVTLLPGQLYLDLRGFGGGQVIGGGFGPAGTTSGVTNSNNLVQTYSLSASPYYVHRFGDTATTQVGYSLQYFGTSGGTGFVTVPPPGSGGLTGGIPVGSTAPFLTSQYTIANEGYWVLRSGPDFGRFAAELRTVGTVYDSNGVLSGGHRLISTVQTAYSINRQIALLLEAGYENQFYGGTQPLSIDGPVWSAGFRWTPNPDSSVTVKYGFRNGFYSGFLNGNVAVGARTRLFGTYAETLGTLAQQATDLLSTATVDAYGNPVNTIGGTPIIAAFGGSLLATQSSLQRTKRFTAGVTYSLERDTVGLNGFWIENTPVTTQPGTVAFQQKGWSVGVNWSRQLRPALTSFAYAQFGQTETPGSNSTSNFYNASLTLTQALAQDLNLSLQYFYTSNSSAFLGTTSTLGSSNTHTNVVILALRKSF